MRGRIAETQPGPSVVKSQEPYEVNGRPGVPAHANEPEPRSVADPLAALADELDGRDAANPLQVLSYELDGPSRPVARAAPTPTGFPADPGVPPGHRRAGRRRLQMTLAALLALACAAAAVATIRAFVASSRDQFPGVIQPTQAISLDFSEPGYLSSVRPSPGDHVRAGEVLARLNPVGAHALKLAAQAATAAVASAEQQLAVAEHSVTGLPAVRLAGVVRAKAELATDQARVAQAKSVLDQAAIRSPVNGVVTDVSGAVGDLVGPSGVQIDGIGQPTQPTQAPILSLFAPASRRTAATNRDTASPLIQLAAGPTEMAAQVPESAVRAMRPGREAKVTVLALGASFRARLLRVVPDPVQANGGVTYEVLFVLQQPNPQVLPGMSADVTLSR